MHILSDRHSRSRFIHFNLIISLLSRNSVTSSLQDFPFICILRQQTAQDITQLLDGNASKSCQGETHDDDSLRPIQGWHMVLTATRHGPTSPFAFGWRGSCSTGLIVSITPRAGYLSPIPGQGQSLESTTQRSTHSCFWREQRAPDLFPRSSNHMTSASGGPPSRGAILKTTHQGVDSKMMELINRWRSKEAAKGSVLNLQMQQVYTEVKSILTTMLEYSWAL